MGSFPAAAGILLGFQYGGDEKYRLPVVFDLYLCYQYLREKLGPEALLLVATDAGQGRGLALVHEEDLTSAISQGRVDNQVVHFADFLLGAPHKDRNLRLRSCLSLADLEAAAAYFRPHAKNKLFLYYSGHGEDESVLLPSGEKIKGDSFLAWAVSLGSPQIFCLADCCSLGPCRLPFRSAGGSSRLRPPPRREYTFRRERVALLLSSEGDAHGDNFGSFFTREFFSSLRRGVASWEEILKTPVAKPAFYSSFPEEGEVWPWVS